MITITGYKQIEYGELVKALNQQFVDSGKKEMEVALELQLSSANTIRNTFKEDGQIVSDKVLTGVMKSVGLTGCVAYFEGERLYYISNKKN